jgi:hypothetical protein
MTGSLATAIKTKKSRDADRTETAKQKVQAIKKELAFQRYSKRRLD